MNPKLFVNVIVFIILFIMFVYLLKCMVKEEFEDNTTMFNKFIDVEKDETDENDFKSGTRIKTFDQNTCHPNCCADNASMFCSKGCVCLSDKDKQLLHRSF